MSLAVKDRELADASSGTKTIASRAKALATAHPDKVAMRRKDLGIWQEMTWGEMWELVELAANGLLAFGTDVGDRVSIHAEDRPEWIIMDIATVAVRGIAVGLYPTNPAAEVEYTLNDCGSRIHLAEDQEQADKVLELPDGTFRALERIIYLEPRGISEYDDPRLLPWEEFLELGRAHRSQNPTDLADRMAAAEPEDVMTLVYTSGTTGPPKGAMLTNANCEFGLDLVVKTPERMPGKPPNGDDQIVTYLPLCHVAERLFSTWHLISAAPILNFAESTDQVAVALRDIQPTLFFAVPRIWERLHAGVIIRAADASPIKKFFFGQSMKLAAWIGRSRVANNGNWTPATRVAYAIGWVLVFRALRERLGLRHCRYAASGAAPIAPEVLEFFIGIGLNVYELYGMTENTAVATANLHGRMKLGTVGEPYPEIKDGFRIDEETGEIQVKHDGVFAGYWGKPEATAEAFTEDGWLRTGDVGEWDGDHVRIVDRIKHIIITSGGKNISPSEIENSLKTSPFVNEAMVIGDRRKYLVALIAIELETVAAWAQGQGLAYTTYRDLTEKPEVMELIQSAVDKTNERFARVETIKKFRLLPKELDHEDGDLTATQKLKRSAMEDTYGPLVEEMYA
ncbi:MAG: long-chain fatty acid--CoA ligase [Actinomycetota bacterium]